MHESIARLEEAISAVFLGKPRIVRLVLTGFFAQGHMLLEDVPGVPKRQNATPAATARPSSSSLAR